MFHIICGYIRFESDYIHESHYVSQQTLIEQNSLPLLNDYLYILSHFSLGQHSWFNMKITSLCCPSYRFIFPNTLLSGNTDVTQQELLLFHCGSLVALIFKTNYSKKESWLFYLEASHKLLVKYVNSLILKANICFNVLLWFASNSGISMKFCDI